VAASGELARSALTSLLPGRGIREGCSSPMIFTVHLSTHPPQCHFIPLAPRRGEGRCNKCIRRRSRAFYAEGIWRDEGKRANATTLPVDGTRCCTASSKEDVSKPCTRGDERG
jgi:hypothetical protein